ncbi:MAG: M48 family metallopeptidase [Nostocaceae cyanobacterium]|nr:M48 family metallopeptidase [Nostocaceae cyanobacterium]
MINWKILSLNYSSFRRRWLYPLISIVVAIGLCLSTPMPSQAISIWKLLLRGAEVVTPVVQLSNISDRQEISIGKQINKQLLDSKVKLYRDSQVNNYIKQIGQRLVPYSSRPDLTYTFQVVDDDSVNAFATMGGFVYIHTGLIKAAKNEAELASVMAHEIGHIGGKHLVKQMRKRAIASGLVKVAGIEESKLVQIGVELAYQRPNSRRAEYDADRRGLRSLTAAGYAQSGMVSFMEKLMQKSSTMPTFLSTHPATSDRITALKSQINAKPSNRRDGLNEAVYQRMFRSVI